MKRFLILLIIFFFVGTIFSYASSLPPELSTFLNGETLNFNIDVFFLKNVAVGNAFIECIDPDKGIFQATVEAEIVKFFIDRRNVYTSLMMYSPEEKKFKPISFTDP